jgi:hypothetical protein
MQRSCGVSRFRKRCLQKNLVLLKPGKKKKGVCCFSDFFLMIVGQRKIATEMV